MEKNTNQLTYEQLLHYYHSTCGLWAIDRNPQEVDIDWIRRNAFQLKAEDATQKKKKEFAIGEEFQFGLKRLRVEKDTKETPCMGCVFCSPAFLCGDIVENFTGQCMGYARSDKTNVMFVEVK